MIHIEVECIRIWGATVDIEEANNEIDGLIRAWSYQKPQMKLCRVTQEV